MFVLSSELRAWVRPGLLGVVCTVDAAGRPQIVRHWGVRARAVADELEFYLCAAASVPCLLSLGQPTRVALNLIELPSYRSRTFKGQSIAVDATVDPDFLALSVEAAGRAMHSVGMARDAAERMLGPAEPARMVAVRMTVDSVFDQTPKPGAGCAL